MQLVGKKLLRLISLVIGNQKPSMRILMFRCPMRNTYKFMNKASIPWHAVGYVQLSLSGCSHSKLITIRICSICATDYFSGCLITVIQRHGRTRLVYFFIDKIILKKTLSKAHICKDTPFRKTSAGKVSGPALNLDKVTFI